MPANSYHHLLSYLLLVLMTMVGCTDDDYLFRHVPPAESGIYFSNDISESDSFNILNFHYIYNGAGVGVADLNHDSLPDLVFSANEGPPTMYLNTGALHFKEIPSVKHALRTAWYTGVSIVDINADGWDDVYLSVGGLDCEQNDCYNQLLVHQGLDNQGMPQFKEMAEAYGLEDGRYTQQAAFFDYDLDGDLDVYLLHNVIDARDKNTPSAKHFISDEANDQLLQNDGFGLFSDVSEEMGIAHRGYGLGITINDINQDHYPDIYIANDFLSEDALYINQWADGQSSKPFKNKISTLTKHNSYNAMGVDIADVNNDALPDIFVLDMLPETNERQKNMLGFMNYNKFALSLRQGYHPQFMKNTLQLHNGYIQDTMLPYSDVSYYAGLHQTDWSWTPLLADFDNDGDRDVYVTNGYGKDITDLDFINYSEQRNPFGTNQTQHKELYGAVQKLKEIKIPNYFFENQGALSFANQKSGWIREENSISNGAVYADLDLDGDLDLVVNNLNQQAYVLENTAQRSSKSHYIQLELHGPEKNKNGIGATINIWTEGAQQSHFQSPLRGYLSSVDATIHFGIGAAELVDSIQIIYPWIDQEGFISSKMYYNIPADQVLHIQADEIIKMPIAVRQNNKNQKIKPLLRSLQNEKPKLSQEENVYEDFDKQHLLLRRYSRLGPCLASADISENTGSILFTGGAIGTTSKIYHDPLGTMIELDDASYEVCDAAFLDIDGDGYLDLYTAVGGSEYPDGSNELMDQLYLGDGSGDFVHKLIKLPTTSSSVIAPCDYNQDGDTDLFVGSMTVPGHYPKIPRSHLLSYTDDEMQDQIQDKLGSEHLGMITDAIWSDVDQNGWDDLIIVGEWMPLTIFKNDEGRFTKMELPHTAGLARAVAVADLDEDGDPDIIIGNHGTNGKIKASSVEPLVLYTGDFDQNGSEDPVIGHYALGNAGTRHLFPLHTRDDVFRQLPKLENKYLSYASFGRATMEDIFEKPIYSESFLRVEELRSIVLINDHDGWKIQPLPMAAQLASVNDILAEDFNQDGHTDLLLSMNDYTTETNMGWSDASHGLMLMGNGSGALHAMSAAESGFYVPGDGRDIDIRDNQNNEKVIAVSQNDGPIIEYKIEADIML